MFSAFKYPYYAANNSQFVSLFVYLLSQNVTDSAFHALTLLGYAKHSLLLHSELNGPNLRIRFFQDLQASILPSHRLSIHPSIHPSTGLFFGKEFY